MTRFEGGVLDCHVGKYRHSFSAKLGPKLDKLLPTCGLRRLDIQAPLCRTWLLSQVTNARELASITCNTDYVVQFALPPACRSNVQDLGNTFELVRNETQG